MTDVEFARRGAEHPDLRFEMTAGGELIVMPPAFPIAGLRTCEINRQLANWAIADRRGVVSDSSTGFVLPNGARYSPNAAWTLKSRVQRLAPAVREGFWHLCPDFVIELNAASHKMSEWIDNGAALAWLIEPATRSVTIYRPGRQPETVAPADTLAAEGPLQGFILSLPRVWDPLGF